MPDSFVIHTHALSKTYKETAALKPLDLNVPHNSIFGLLGPNGAGKPTTLMLGTFFTHRATVIGIPLALAFGQQMLIGQIPALAGVLRWMLAVPLDDQHGSFAAAMLQGQAPPDLLPLYSALIFIVLFGILALWKFEREEF